VIAFTDDAWDDYLYWHSQDKVVFKRVNALIKDAMRDPFAGVGKPESLKHSMSGYWSRRITDEHRMVYTVSGNTLTIAQLRYHYR
jgi:toxin YoeB